MLTDAMANPFARPATSRIAKPGTSRRDTASIDGIAGNRSLGAALAAAIDSTLQQARQMCRFTAQESAIG